MFTFEATEIDTPDDRVELQPGALGSKENPLEVEASATLQDLMRSTAIASLVNEKANLHLRFRDQDYVYTGVDTGVKLETFHGVRSNGKPYTIEVNEDVIEQARKENRTDILSANDLCLRMNLEISQYRYKAQGTYVSNAEHD